MAKKTETTTTTIRLNSKLREALETIAAREQRSLSGQITLFLRKATEEYLAENNMTYFEDIQAYGTPFDYAGYLATRDEKEE